MSWSVGKQEIENNRTRIDWEIGVQGQSGTVAYWYSNAVRINSAYISGSRISGSYTYSNITLSGATRRGLRSGSTWVSHRNDGTASAKFTVSGWLYGNGDFSASDTWALPTIPRNSQVSTDAGSSYELGTDLLIRTNRKSSTFTHSITIRLHNSSGPIIRSFNSVGSSVTWNPTSSEINTMQNAIPNTNRLNLHIRQYNNQVKDDSTVTVASYIKNGNPQFSDFTYRDSSPVATITGNDQILVKGQSTLEVTISEANKMVPIKGANGDNYSILYDGVTKQRAYQASGDITESFTNVNTTGQRTLRATATDTRGNNTAVSKQVTVYDYVLPTINASLERENSFGIDTTLSMSGTYTPLVIGGVEKNQLTVGSLEYRYRETGGEFGAWTSRGFTASGGSWSATDFILALDNEKSYEFEFRIADLFGTVVATAIVDVGQPLFFVGDNNGIPAISVGQMPDPGVALQVGDNFKVDANGNMLSGPIYWCAQSTSNQETGTAGTSRRIAFGSMNVFGGDLTLAGSGIVLPSDGWVKVTVTVSVIGGSGADDSMSFGVLCGASTTHYVYDNWRAKTLAGVEHCSSMTVGFPVTAGEELRAFFDGVQGQSITLMGGRCYMEGTFIPA